MNKKSTLYLGIELGSTRVKAVLCNEHYDPIASGSALWENQLIDGYWTYDLSKVWQKIRMAYKAMAEDYQRTNHCILTEVSAMGISGMMHGYLPFDHKGNLLTPFRTWRNNRQLEASEKLTDLFAYPVPQRWSIAHYYQAMLNNEEHLSQVDYLTTLAGYVHWQLTGEKCLGIGEASGMFPIDSQIGDYNKQMVCAFEEEAKKLGHKVSLSDQLPKVLTAGQEAGILSEKGAALLDPSGNLASSIPMCPPEGDAATGMVATNSVKVRSGNISSGTSVFAMIVLEKTLEDLHSEIDLVTTPSGDQVAMVHVNNGTSDLNAWVSLFGQAITLMGGSFDINDLYGRLYRESFNGDEDCDGMLAFGYISGEHIPGLEEGRPLFLRKPDSRFNLANFMKTHLYASLAVLRMGMDILTQKEGVTVEEITGHGGFFNTADVGQRYMAAATGLPVTILENSGQGGPWGMAILAGYMATESHDRNLGDFLEEKVFSRVNKLTVKPQPKDMKGFEAYLAAYIKAVKVEKTAIDCLD